MRSKERAIYSEITLSIADEVKDFFPSVDLYVIREVLSNFGNDIGRASERLQELEMIQPVLFANETSAKRELKRPKVPREDQAVKNEIRVRRKLMKMYPTLTYDSLTYSIQQCGLDLTALVCFLCPQYGLPTKGKYLNKFKKLSAQYPQFDPELILSLLIKAQFGKQKVLEVLSAKPVVLTQEEKIVQRHIAKLSSKFPDEHVESLRQTLEFHCHDYNKALKELKEKHGKANTERATGLHMRLMELYGEEHSELFYEIGLSQNFDLLKSLEICTEIIGPPGSSLGPAPLSQHNLREVAPIEEVRTDTGFLPDHEFAEKRNEMESLHTHFKSLNLQAKDLRRAGLKEQARVLSEQAKIEKHRANLIYNEIYEETFRRNNLKRGLNTVDLHGLKVEEAMTVLERYLAIMQDMVRDQQIAEFKILIITGWGKHNANHTSILKEKSAQMLARKQLVFYEHNRGSFEVVLKC